MGYFPLETVDAIDDFIASRAAFDARGQEELVESMLGMRNALLHASLGPVEAGLPESSVDYLREIGVLRGHWAFAFHPYFDPGQSSFGMHTLHSKARLLTGEAFPDDELAERIRSAAETVSPLLSPAQRLILESQVLGKDPKISWSRLKQMILRRHQVVSTIDRLRKEAIALEAQLIRQAIKREGVDRASFEGFRSAGDPELQRVLSLSVYGIQWPVGDLMAQAGRIAHLFLSRRVDFIGDLASRRASDLLNVRGVGEVTLMIIQEHMRQLGLGFGMETGKWEKPGALTDGERERKARDMVKGLREQRSVAGKAPIGRSARIFGARLPRTGPHSLIRR